MSVKEDHPIAVGRIRLEVPKLAELKAPVKSTVVSIANMPWSLEVMSECSKRTSDTKQFSIYINCNEDNKNPHWSCQASIGFNLMSSKVGLKSLSKTFVHTFRTTPTSKGLPSFIAWDKVLDPENCFIRESDGGVVVEATVTVTKVVVLPVSTLCDFTAPQPNLTDVALIVEEKPLHVIKTYLACHSPVFHSMFFSEFAEKEKKEIPLPDVTYDEFVELLHVIFPSRKPVTVETVESLLCLADRFSMQVVLHSCEEFLRGPDSEEIPLAKKLLLSDQYRLASLQSVCLNALKSIDDVKVLKTKMEYRDLTDKTKLLLLSCFVPDRSEYTSSDCSDLSGKVENPIAVGKIRLDVPKVAELKTIVKSPVVSIANMPWNLEVTSECSKRTLDIKQFSIFAYCNVGNKNLHWSCEAKVTFNLLSSKSRQKSHSREPIVHTFCSKQNAMGHASFIAWDKLLDPVNGFIREEDGGVVIEVTITVTKVIGWPMSTLCEFTAPEPDLTDIALIVEEKPLHVSKAYLAYHSPVFHSMFFSEFAEKEKKEIPLPDVTYDEFVELLHVIFPSRKPVTVDTVEFLLRLADRFSVQVVLLSCEEFLRGPDSEKIPLVKKLLLADQFRLASLQSVCLNALKSIDDVNELKTKKEFCDLSDKTKASLGERILELC